VTSSVDDEPLSDDAARSGFGGSVGAVASTVRFNDGPAAEVLPAGSVNVPDTVHVPSVRSGRSHDVAVPTRYEHVLVIEPFVAVTVAVSPTAPPATDTAGVESRVASSDEETPLSEESSRSTFPGAAGGDVSTVSAVVEAVEPGLPAASTTDADKVQVPSVSAGRSHDVAEPTV